MPHPIVRPALEADYPAIAALLVRLDADPASRDLHTYETPANVLADDMAAIAGRGELVALVEETGGRVTGAFVLDVAHDRGRAWSWGPAVDADVDLAFPSRRKRAALLLKRGIAALPDAVTRISFFPDCRHRAMLELLDAQGARRATPVHVYAAGRPAHLPPAVARLAVPGDRDALAALHDASFPKTGANADELLARSQDTARLFVADAPDGTLAGYVAAKRQDDGTGYIDYVATAPDRRGRGVATGLLAAALHWLFVEKDVPVTYLTVSDDRATARGLYEKAGFRLHQTGQPFDLFIDRAPN